MNCLNNLGYAYLEKEDLEEAKRYYKNALHETEEREAEEFPVLYKTNKNLAVISLREGNSKDALTYGEIAKEIANRIGDEEKIREIESKIAEIKRNIQLDEMTKEVNLLCEDLKDQKEDLLEDINKRSERRNLYFSKEDTRNLRSQNFLLIAKKHNSFTPAVPEPKRKSVGGGYFLMWHGKGIAIDPGFDFVTNIYKEWLSISHIDAVIITHSHPDHVNDFITILTLLYEFNDLLPSNEEKKRIDVLLNTGASLRFKGWLCENRYVREIIMDKEIPIRGHDFGYDFTIHPVKAYHDEYGNKESTLGFVIEFSKNFKLGITSDTKWLDDLHTYYFLNFTWFLFVE